MGSEVYLWRIGSKQATLLDRLRWDRVYREKQASKGETEDIPTVLIKFYKESLNRIVVYKKYVLYMHGLHIACEKMSHNIPLYSLEIFNNIPKCFGIKIPVTLIYTYYKYIMYYILLYHVFYNYKNNMN